MQKNIFKKIFNYLEHFGVSMSGYIQRRLRIGLTVRFSFPRISFVHNGVRTIEFPDERDTQRGGYAKTACREARAPEKEV